MPTIELIPDWKPHFVAIRDTRVSAGPLSLELFEGFPTLHRDPATKAKVTSRPEWVTAELPRELRYEMDHVIGPSPLPARTSVRVEADPETVTIIATVQNTGASIIDEIELNPCLAFRHCPEMADDTGERLYVRHEGRWKNWLEMRRYVHVGWHANVQMFEVVGRPSRVRDLAEFYNDSKWGTSPDRVDAPVAARVHPATELAVGIAFDRSHKVAGNCNASHHCIHSFGLVSDLCPGDRRTRVCKIFVCPGGLEQLWQRYQRELTPLI